MMFALGRVNPRHRTMKRTASRPTLNGKIPAPNALKFAFAMAAGAFAILWAGANLLAAMLAVGINAGQPAAEAPEAVVAT